MFIFYLISSLLSFNIQIDGESLQERVRSVPGQEALPKLVRFIALDGDIRKITIEIESEKIEKRTFPLVPPPHPLTPSPQYSHTPTPPYPHTPTPPYSHTPIPQYPNTPIYYRQVSLGGYPLLYLAIFQELDTLRLKNIRLNIETVRRDYRYNPEMTDLVRSIVINPEVVEQKNEEYGKFVVITKNEFLSAFEPLLKWKTKRGRPSDGISIEWIYENFPSGDSARSIKDYITYAYENMDVDWVLLAGDVDIIPAKRQYVVTGGYADSIVSDLFYSDLYSPWDSCDMLPDVIIGRAPVNTKEEAEVFVEKVLRYEREPDSTYIESAFFLGFPVDAINDFYDVKQYIANSFLGDFYVQYGAGGVSNTLSGLNQGYHLVNHGGHGDYDKIEVKGECLTSTHVDGLVNRTRPFLFYTVGCKCGGFQKDCIGEHFLLNPYGGAFAFIGNTSFGWCDSADVFKYSGEFDTLFYKILMNPDMFEISRSLGDVFKRSKTPFISFEDDPYRWCQFSLNLLGDPELPIFLKNPITPEVTHPALLPLSPCTVKIYVKRNGINYYGATVCIRKEEDFYLVDYCTNTYGYAKFILNPVSHGICDVCVTGPGISPYEGNIFIGDSLFPDFYLETSYVINDASDDMRLDAGEEADFVTLIGNSGARDANNVYARLSTDDIYVTIIDSESYIDDIRMGDIGEGIFRVFACEDTPLEYEASLSLRLKTETGYIEDIPIKIKVGRYSYEYGTHSAGNFYFTLSNDGSYGFTSPYGKEGVGFIYPKDGENLLSYGTFLFGNSSYICDNSLDSDFVCERGLYIGDKIFSDEDSWCRFTDGGSPTPHNVTITQQGWVFGDSTMDDFIIIKIDAQAEEPISAYIGAWLDFDIGDETAEVSNGIGCVHDDSLYTAIAPIYGDVKNISVIENEIYIYPEGGLSDYYAYRFLSGELSFENGEIPGDYSLLLSFGPYYIEGKREVAFAIVGGFSMDDIENSVSRAKQVYNAVGIEEENLRFTIDDLQLKVYPNPFRGKTTIGFSVSGIGYSQKSEKLHPAPCTLYPVSLKIYDLSGRMVKTLVDGKVEAGHHSVKFDGSSLPSGIYFARLTAGDYRDTKKLVLLR